MPVDDSPNFEYSLTEIKKQLEEMGYSDFSQTNLANFQRDLQDLVNHDETRSQASASSSEITLTQNFNLDEVTEGISLSEDDDDNADAVSIMSTNLSLTSSRNPAKTKRKTLRNGVVTDSLSLGLGLGADLDQSLTTTISDYLEPEDLATTSASHTRQRSKSSIAASKSKSKSKSSTSKHSNRVNFRSYDDSYTESRSDNRNRQSLYDEKIDDFVKALLEGDETVLDNESVLSDLSRTHDDLDLAGSLNPPKKSNSKLSQRSQRSNGNQPLDVEQLPPPPSFIRPATAPAAGKRVNWHDPVKRFAEYSKYWNYQPKCNAKRDHRRTTRIKWQVRNELADLVRENDQKLLQAKEQMGDYGGYQPRRPSSRGPKPGATYVVPTEKKRHDIRWQIRNILQESGTA